MKDRFRNKDGEIGSQVATVQGPDCAAEGELFEEAERWVLSWGEHAMRLSHGASASDFGGTGGNWEGGIGRIFSFNFNFSGAARHISSPAGLEPALTVDRGNGGSRCTVWLPKCKALIDPSEINQR
jgi:hypothetical protein